MGEKNISAAAALIKIDRSMQCFPDTSLLRGGSHGVAVWVIVVSRKQRSQNFFFMFADASVLMEIGLVGDRVKQRFQYVVT